MVLIEHTEVGDGETHLDFLESLLGPEFEHPAQESNRFLHSMGLFSAELSDNFRETYLPVRYPVRYRSPMLMH